MDDLLEEEVIVDELLSLSGGEGVKRVELALEVTLEGVAGLDNLVHDLLSLLVGDAGSKRVVFKVTANSNTGGHDHGSLVLGEGGSVQSGGVHVGDVGGVGGVTVVVLDDLVEELVEGSVGVVGASVETDAGVSVLAAREDAGSEVNALRVNLVLVLLPDLLGEVLGEERLVGTLGEVGELSKLLLGLQPATTLDLAGDGRGSLVSFLSFSGVVAAHSKFKIKVIIQSNGIRP